MKSRLTWEKIILKLRNPFRVSYGVSQERQAYWIRLENDSGWGEGTIPPYYGVRQAEMVSFWQMAAESSKAFPDAPEEIVDWIGDSAPAPARCGLDLALHDRMARVHKIPLYQLLGLPYPKPKTSAFTIGSDLPDEMAKMAKQVAKFPIIKIKLGCDQYDMERLLQVRGARPDAHLWVDANGGWNLDDAMRYLRDLETLRVALLEQPLHKDDIVGMGKLQFTTKIPIVADESVQSQKDINVLAAAGVQGVNIKLMKVGGLAPALALIRQSQKLGLSVMLGCMIETSIGTTAMAHLSGLAAWLDLDASALIENDPFEGMTFDGEGTVRIPDRDGIGVSLKAKGQM
jgi:L-Ala-D/L-Glu epimerase